ncbi:hypothetical protein PN462_00720, partial [Spirulina sp. CS-785/01]|uniref:hypothetical protein n=1 Tax=Spirulina sp. CS-785/01 TaxID=3021716 RepID=UPI00232A8660
MFATDASKYGTQQGEIITSLIKKNAPVMGRLGRLYSQPSSRVNPLEELFTCFNKRAAFLPHLGTGGGG